MCWMPRIRRMARQRLTTQVDIGAISVSQVFIFKIGVLQFISDITPMLHRITLGFL
jgi:hypothetical protein